MLARALFDDAARWRVWPGLALGHCNFSAFANGYRPADAKAALAET
ncbi:MAG TPA: hypothetical protein VFY73_26730 [Ideonella sp.]|nr:hypothetical protein [Ideonella sp.]HEX5687625.1 hypothetical protein [Ideonella sp.]